MLKRDSASSTISFSNFFGVFTSETFSGLANRSLREVWKGRTVSAPKLSKDGSVRYQFQSGPTDGWITLDGKDRIIGFGYAEREATYRSSIAYYLEDYRLVDGRAIPRLLRYRNDSTDGELLLQRYELDLELTDASTVCGNFPDWGGLPNGTVLDVVGDPGMKRVVKTENGLQPVAADYNSEASRNRHQAWLTAGGLSAAAILATGALLWWRKRTKA